MLSTHRGSAALCSRPQRTLARKMSLPEAIGSGPAGAVLASTAGGSPSSALCWPNVQLAEKNVPVSTTEEVVASTATALLNVLSV